MDEKKIGKLKKLFDDIIHISEEEIEIRLPQSHWL